MHLHMYIYTCLHIHINAYIYTHILCLPWRISLQKHPFSSIVDLILEGGSNNDLPLCVYIYIYIYVYIYICIYIYIYIYMYTWSVCIRKHHFTCKHAYVDKHPGFLDGIGFVSGHLKSTYLLVHVDKYIGYTDKNQGYLDGAGFVSGHLLAIAYCKALTYFCMWTNT